MERGKLYGRQKGRGDTSIAQPAGSVDPILYYIILYYIILTRMFELVLLNVRVFAPDVILYNMVSYCTIWYHIV